MIRPLLAALLMLAWGCDAHLPPRDGGAPQDDAATADAGAHVIGHDDGGEAQPRDGGSPLDAASPRDASSPADAGTDAGDPERARCMAIAPTLDPAANHATIAGCLRDHGIAQLTAGTFPISDEIDMPSGSVLRGDTTWPRIVMARASAQSLVRLHDDNEVAFLRLDGNHRMTVAHNAIVRFMGSRSFVHDNHVQDGEGTTGDHTTTGVRFWTVEGRENRAFRNQLHHLHYGVIFDLFPNGADNLLDGNLIYEVRCDAVTFRGYGRARDNVISRNGWQCLNPATSPIPGGGFYTLDNPEGAEIRGNEVREVCGIPLDLDNSARFEIHDNLFERNGFRWSGRDHCGAGMTAHLIDMRRSNITGNTFRADGHSTVAGDPNRVFSATGSGLPTDLPAGTNTSVAFALTSRRAHPGRTTGNHISDNRFIASCSAPCVGVGYFAGRGTGLDASGGWSASTTNYYTENDPFGSNYGSKRCGGNWYAADATCNEGSLAPSCNRDDPQHNGAGHDWSRNDSCARFQ